MNILRESISLLKGNGIVTALGILTTASLLYRITSWFSIYLRSSHLHRYLHLSSTGAEPWALVTGATAGIGRAFAHELAAAGFNVVIHGRSQAKLDAVREDLRKTYSTRQFQTLAIDASKVAYGGSPATFAEDTINFDAIAARLRSLHLTVLVNNVGGGPRNPTFATLDRFSDDAIVENITLNAVFPTLLLARLLPQLARSGPALVLTAGSLAADLGLPLMSFYGPAKAFLAAQAQVLAYDCALEGLPVEVLAVRFGTTRGVQFSGDKPPTWLEPDARTMARAALARVGCGRVVVTGYLPHALQFVLVGSLPGRLRARVLIYLMKQARAEEGQSSKTD